MVRAVRATAKAAGLKICFFPIAKRYFDAIAHTDAAPDAYPEIHHLTRPLRAAATRADDPATPNLWAGTGWRAVSPDPAEVIVRRLATGLRELTGS